MFSKKQLIEVSSGLNKFLNSGISIQSALILLKEETKDKKVKKLLDEMIEGVENGSSISNVIKNKKDIPLIFKNLIYVGENTGNMPKSLERISKYYEESMDLKRELISKLIYPSIILISLLIMSFGYTFILSPTYKNMAASIGSEMPKSTLWVINVCEFIKNNITYIILISFITIIIFFQSFKIKKIRYIGDKLKFHNRLLKLLNLREAFFLMYLLLSSGMGIINTIYILEQNTKNIFLKEIMSKVQNDIRCGRSLNDIVKNYVKDKTIIYMISIGERTGNIEENILSLSNIYDKELKFNIKVFTSLIEPVLIIFLSIISALLMISMLMPIYSSLTKLN